MSMESSMITFTPEDKSLIYNRFIAPVNGTKEEALQFLRYCENLGLNPLLGDIIFQKYETKFGPKTAFVTTRDGLMRLAVRDKNYAGPPVSNVVREGDQFEFLPAEGSVVHKFGTKRGKILGAYAVLKHKQHATYACWVDFFEYFTANAKSKNGKSYIWDNYPSAMVQKVAEVFALKRQFPVGGLTTEEEIGFEHSMNMPSFEIEESLEKQKESSKSALSSTQMDTATINKNATRQQKEGTQTEKLPNRSISDRENTFSANRNEAETQYDEQHSQTERVEISGVEYGTSPSGISFAKVLAITTNGQPLQLLAKDDEYVSIAKALKQGEEATVIYTEENGFHFLKGVSECA